MTKGYLKVFLDWSVRYQKLTDEEFGRLVRAAISYKSTGVVPQLDGREELVWDGIQIDIDMDNERYAAVGEARSEAGKRGAEARWSAKRQEADGKNSKCHLPHGKNAQEKEEEKEKEEDSKERVKRKKYGEYKNVLLTDEELAKLQEEFPDYLQRIERLSEYMAQHGKSYKSHLAVIRAWARNDQPKTESLGWMRQYLGG